VRVAIVAEWYPSPADPVLGIWAHRQAVAAREAGADVRVIALRRPLPPISALRALLGSPPTAQPLRRWGAGVSGLMRSLELDGVLVRSAPFVAPPRPWSYGSWGLWMAPPLRRALAAMRHEWPFDLVHAHNLLPPGHAAARCLAGGDRVPLVVSTHGPDVIRDWDRSPVARRATRRVLADAALVVANSGWAQGRCETIAGRSLAGRVVHLGTDLPRGLPPKRERLTLVTVAHLIARKRHAVVLHALAALREDVRPDYLVIGDGPGRGPLERLANQLGVARWVTFAGQLPHERALAESRRCHLMVMPSVEEPFGVAFVEAMAAGLPAIGSRSEGGPQDIAAAGDGMLLVDPDDHRVLARTIEQAVERGLDDLGRRARATVEANFTWDRCGCATVEAYSAALEGKGA